MARLSGLFAYPVVAALVFGETALFLGFVLPSGAVRGAAWREDLGCGR
jgi:membrane protein DedA with SNARE-associated domain